MKNKPVGISGISESRVAPVAARIKKEKNGQGLIIVSSQIRAKRLASDLSFFYSGAVYVMPEQEETLVRYDAGSREKWFDNRKALKALLSEEDCIVVAPVSAVMKHLAPHRIFTENRIHLVRGGNFSPAVLREQLTRMGYEALPLIDGRGQFSARGSIVDVFPPDAEHPYRIEFFDDEIDSIRSFDADTQRSIENLKEVVIFPVSSVMQQQEIYGKAAAKIEKEYTAGIRRLEKQHGPDSEAVSRLKEKKAELLELLQQGISLSLMENYIHYFYEDTEYLWNYLPPDSALMIDDPDRVREAAEVRLRELQEDFRVLLENGYAAPKDFDIHLTKGELLDIYEQPGVYLLTPFRKQIKGVSEYSALYNIVSRQTPVFNGRMDLFESELKSYVRHGYRPVVVCANEERLENLGEFVKRAGLDGSVTLLQGSLTAGMEFPEEKICYLRDEDIFGEKKRRIGRRKTDKSIGQKLAHFSDLKNGDYVVHENHGIGKFLGIEQLTVQGIKKDYLKIKYAGKDMLYVPVEQMDLVQKYIGSDDAMPKINRLSGGEWKQTKAKAKAAIAEMAQELLALSAARQVQPGHAFGEDTVWQSEFEDSFPYQETEDQLRCIREIKKDMERPQAMDRLLCGDVGFGKTEVAARALFKCLADGKQAAVLVPTTLLANQHYYTLKERFERFPFTVEVLSRFRNEKQQKEILRKLEEGSVDLVIGTHRLLSSDVRFKDLGLLVIDEEQRFGVQHKEALKKLRTNVDVLTLSATPIPRTLHMSLTGIKDMSVIEQPPEERYPVQTYVLEQDYTVLQEIIERELGRGGQVYVIYNRVQGIHKIAAEIGRLVPDAQVTVGHGQMSVHELEHVMLDFINGETNVLVATTIIESGIDIPNVNTMIILNADRFGLSQLYQLRGRVGRSNRMAYAYLMYEKDKVLSEVAEKRLRAIREFTEFGAGFKVAMRDLEIRGAGNILGSAQHGHMMNVGYELYCKLVDDAVRALKGEIVRPEREETLIELAEAAYIPESYIADEVTKLAMYKRIAAVADQSDEEELTDELIDRFGDLPKETENLMKISRIRSAAERLGIQGIREEKVLSGGKTSLRIVFDFAEKNALRPQSLALLSKEYGPRILIHGGVKPFVRYHLGDGKKEKLDEVLRILECMEQGDKDFSIEPNA